jgi:hypothetical protein
MHIFPVSTVNKNIPGAPIVVSSPLFPYTPIAEIGANHWLLGGNAESLAPFGGSATLTPTGSAHTFGANFATAPSNGNDLRTNIADATTQTMYAVFQYNPIAAKNVMPIGNLSGGATGSGVWINGSGAIETVVRTGANPVLINHGVPAGVSVGDWIFVGLSKRVVEGNSRTLTKIGGTTYEGNTWVGTQALASSSPLAIGAAYNATATYTPVPVNVAELIIKSSNYDDAAAMQAIYLRSKKRMASRGIALK